MKKATKQKLMVLFIVIIFSMSSIAYIINNFTNQKTNEFSFIMDKELEPQTEYELIQNGFTSLKFFYSNDTDKSIIDYVNSLQERFKTNDGYIQIILQKIKSNSTYIIVSSLNGEKVIENLTQENIFSSLCDIVIVTPVECLISNLNSTQSSVQ
ncbi:MAG: hypothetical protein ACTSVB_06940 [Candidatus Heimdallarchaeaceae archaeon]